MPPQRGAPAQVLEGVARDRQPKQRQAGVVGVGEPIGHRPHPRSGGSQIGGGDVEEGAGAGDYHVALRHDGLGLQHGLQCARAGNARCRRARQGKVKIVGAAGEYHRAVSCRLEAAVVVILHLPAGRDPQHPRPGQQFKRRVRVRQPIEDGRWRIHTHAADVTAGAGLLVEHIHRQTDLGRHPSRRRARRPGADDGDGVISGRYPRAVGLEAGIWTPRLQALFRTIRGRVRRAAAYCGSAVSPRS